MLLVVSSLAGEIVIEHLRLRLVYSLFVDCRFPTPLFLRGDPYRFQGSLNNVLRVNYEGGKSKEVRGLVSVKNLGLVQTSSQFNITIKMNSTNSSNIRMVYSTSPGNLYRLYIAFVFGISRFTIECVIICNFSLNLCKFKGPKYGISHFECNRLSTFFAHFDL